MGSIGAPEIIIIAIVVVVLFGAKKLPEAARSVGRSMRIFRSEIKEMKNDDIAATNSTPAVESPAAQVIDNEEPKKQDS